MWLVRGRDHKRVIRLRVLIIVFAAGAVLMGAGVRIILDSIIALVFVIIEANSWRTWKGGLTTFGELVVTGGVGALAVNHRLSSIAELVLMVMAHSMPGCGSLLALVPAR